MHHAGGRVVLQCLAVEPWPPGCGNSRHPVAVRRNRYACEVEQRRHHVLKPDKTIVARAGRDPPIAGLVDDNHRDARRALIEQAFSEQAVIAEHVTVVAAKKNDRLVELTFLAQRAENDTQLMIDVRAERVIGPPHVGQNLGRHGRPVIAHGLQGVGQIIGRCGPVRRQRRFDCPCPVMFEVAGEGRQRRVRRLVGNGPKSGTQRIPPLDVATQLLRRPVRVMQLLGQMPGPMHVAVIGHAMRELLTGVVVVGEKQVIVVDRQMRTAFPRTTARRDSRCGPFQEKREVCPHNRPDSLRR